VIIFLNNIILFIFLKENQCYLNTIFFDIILSILCSKRLKRYSSFTLSMINDKILILAQSFNAASTFFRNLYGMVVVSRWFEFKTRHKKHELTRNEDLIYYMTNAESFNYVI
jgi:hypothetical protein